VDNCIAVNNHKHFILYIVFMVAGIALLIRLTFAYLSILPAPKNPTCTFLNTELCAEFEKDPLTLVTSAWASVQLSWTVMLLFVQFFQVAKNLTTFESMRNTDQVGPVLSAITTGTMSLDDAQVTGPAAGAASTHAQRKKEGCIARWSKLLGVDTFLTIAFQGYNGSKNASSRAPRRKQNPFSRGVLRNCQDFWLDGPVFGRKVGNDGLLGGQRVDYGGLYDVPGGGGRGYRGYEAVPGMEVEEGV
jgi:protein AFG1